MKNHRIAGENDPVLQNQHTNLLIGSFLEPDPVCRIGAKPLLQAGDILPTITDLFTKLGQDTVLKIIQIVFHALPYLLFGHNATQILSQPRMADDKSANVRGNVIVGAPVSAAAVGESSIEIYQLMHVFSAACEGWFISQMLQAPHWEGQRVHGRTHYRIPDIFHP